MKERLLLKDIELPCEEEMRKKVKKDEWKYEVSYYWFRDYFRIFVQSRARLIHTLEDCGYSKEKVEEMSIISKDELIKMTDLIKEWDKLFDQEVIGEII